MPSTFTTPLINQVAGGLVSASQWNAEFTNLYNNLIPAGIDTYSGTDVQMQTATDPFPGGSTSHATSLGGELERIRYMLSLIIGGSNWYNHPPINLTTLNTSTPVIPSGTVMPFYQAAAPTGWTKVTSVNDKAFRIVSGGTGGSTGGGGTGLSSGITLAHTHTVTSHTHDLANHTHNLSTHTHASSPHTHTVTSQGWGTNTSGAPGELVTTRDAGQASAGNGVTSGQTIPGSTGGPNINNSGTPSTNTSGSSSPATDSQLSTYSFAYADFIICSKN